MGREFQHGIIKKFWRYIVGVMAWQGCHWTVHLKMDKVQMLCYIYFTTINEKCYKEFGGSLYQLLNTDNSEINGLYLVSLWALWRALLLYSRNRPIWPKSQKSLVEIPFQVPWFQGVLCVHLWFLIHERKMHSAQPLQKTCTTTGACPWLLWTLLWDSHWLWQVFLL